ncbi:MAG TPA: carbohydrate ABC transporter permease [Candidatus Scybalocola faecipullorum]|nr:carbohydrate ABC transporter permease [Candidatus Scybalocola faecipullorum]
MALIIFGIPFVFILLNSLKDRLESNRLAMSLPTVFHFENYLTVLENNNYQLVTAFKNSIIMTIGAVIVLIITGSMAGYVLQRRKDRITKFLSKLVLIGLMIPTAILPTIWVLQKLGIYKTMFSIILLQTALNISFTIMLYQNFMETIPVELEEAGFMDGASTMKLFAYIIFPLLKPVTATVVIINAISVFNDFTTPLYFFPGSENATVQLTLYNYIGQFANSYNLLFADVIVIVIPMLILFLIFNNRIVDGMTAGSVKG